MARFEDNSWTKILVEWRASEDKRSEEGRPNQRRDVIEKKTKEYAGNKKNVDIIQREE